MIGLIPRDHWEYSLVALFRSMAAAVGAREHGREIHIPGLGRAIPVGSGRAGLIAALKALNLRPGSRIGVPLYCCPVVFSAIAAAGFEARFVDVEPGTFCLSPEDLSAKRSQVEAVIAVHMFGNVCDIDDLKKAAPGLPIIEDCAQALGSKMNGRMAGSLGTIAFFSFRSGKYLSAGEGGALYSRDPDMLARTSRWVGEMPVSSRASDCRHAAKTYLKSILRTRPLYGLLGYRLWQIYNNKTKFSEVQGITQGQISMADLINIENRLPLLDSMIERQRANAEYYSGNLKLGPGMLCLEKPDTFYNRYLYPITFPVAGQRDEMAACLLRRRIDTMKYLGDVVDIAIAQFRYKGDCPVAEQLAKRVLIIPGYYALRIKDLERIVLTVNSAWAAIGSRA